MQTHNPCPLCNTPGNFYECPCRDENKVSDNTRIVADTSGLETIAHMAKTRMGWVPSFHGTGQPVVTRSNAEVIIAAKDAEIERWHRKAMDAGVITHSDGTTSHPMRKERDDLKADNAALTARVKELEGRYSFTSDDDALAFLERYGHKETVNGIIKADMRSLDDMCRAAVAYLCGEWDFVFQDEVELNRQALETQLAAASKALEPFALISSEGVIGTKSGHVTVTTCAEYFHEARAALEDRPSPSLTDYPSWTAH